MILVSFKKKKKKIYRLSLPVVYKSCHGMKTFIYGGTVNSGKHISLTLMLPSMPVISVRERISLGKCVWGHTAFPGGTHITV